MKTFLVSLALVAVIGTLFIGDSVVQACDQAFASFRGRGAVVSRERGRYRTRVLADGTVVERSRYRGRTRGARRGGDQSSCAGRDYGGCNSSYEYGYGRDYGSCND